MGLLKVLVVLALVSAVFAVEADTDRPRRHKQRAPKKMVAPTIIGSNHLMPKSRVVVVPKGA
jgi:hypothetical protein